MTEELITTANKNGKDRSVPNADRLLTPESDKAGDLGKAALLPVPDGVPLLEAGASRDERKSSLRRIGRGVVDLVYRLMKRTGWRSADEDHETADNESGDSENEHSHAEEELDELTQQRINKIDEEWEFRADVNGFNGNFIPKSYPDFAGSIARGDYEEIEKLVPDIRERVAKDDRLNWKSKGYDEKYVHYYTNLDLPVLAQKNVAALFRKHYKHMPKLADSARRAMQEQVDSTHSLKNSDSGDFFSRYYRHEEAVTHLMSAEAVLPGEIAEEFEGVIVGEVAEAIEISAASMGWRRFDTYAVWLVDHGFPPERWPQDARDREDFPEPLRRLVNEQGDKEKGLDRAIIKYCIEKTEIYGDDGKMKPDIYGRCDLIQKYFEGRLPDVNPKIMTCGIVGMVDSSSSDNIGQQVGRYNDYIRTIRGIGQDNANKLGKELGITHFSDWSPEVLRGTLHILETGCTESGNSATIIIRGVTGDHNGAARSFRNIKTSDILAVEINHTDMLSGVIERLEKVGVDSDTFSRVVLFGHGSEEGLTVSFVERIKSDPDEWRSKKGMMDLMRVLNPKFLILLSCHPLRRENESNPLAIDERGPQRRQGTASAISSAFPITVKSGLAGMTRAYISEDDKIIIETEDEDNGHRSDVMALTRYGITYSYERGETSNE